MICNNEHGSGLVLAILTVVALVALGTALTFLTRTDVNISRHQTLHTESVYVAEAGVEEALHRLSLSNPTNVTVNGSTINAAIEDATDPYDPDWKARIFLARPGAEPVPGASEFHTVTVQDDGSWLEYSDASDLNQALTIEHKWKDLDDDGAREAGEIVLYDAGQYPPENFTSGSPVEVITVTGLSATSEREVMVEAVRFPMSANAKAALLCDMGVDVRGNVTVCGHDHSLNTPHYTMLPACKVWELCSNRTTCGTTGCLTGVMTTGDDIDRRGSTDLAGTPPMDTSSTNQFYTLAQMLGLSQEDIDEILGDADYHSCGEASPQDGITYIDNAAGSEAKWAGNAVGSGLLYVTGDFTTTGNFQWKGLIYVEGDYVIAGTPSIIGAVVVRGHSTYAFSGGSPCILFSSEAINQLISKHLKYIRIGWKETSGL